MTRTRAWTRTRGPFVIFREQGRWDNREYQGWHVRIGRVVHLVWKPWHRRLYLHWRHVDIEVRP